MESGREQDIFRWKKLQCLEDRGWEHEPNGCNHQTTTSLPLDSRTVCPLPLKRLQVQSSVIPSWRGHRCVEILAQLRMGRRASTGSWCPNSGTKAPAFSIPIQNIGNQAYFWHPGLRMEGSSLDKLNRPSLRTRGSVPVRRADHSQIYLYSETYLGQ